MRNLLLKVSVVLAFFLSIQVQLTAQDVAYMTGVVTDTTGAVLPGTRVTLSNSLTGVTFTKITDNLGSYRFLNVPPSPGYKAVFTHSGFATAVFTNITMIVGVTRTQNARLAVGTTSQTVQVSASDSIVTLDTTDAAIGNNIDVEELQNLPVYDRTTGINTLFLEQPGVDSFQGAVTGARIDQSSVTLDGMDTNDLAAGTTFYIVGQAPVDSVQQFSGTVAGLVPSQGTGSGAQFQLVTKGGTNKYHGNVNEYNRTTATTSNNFFNNLYGLPRTALVRNQFGGDIGGPILKDKLFFYFDLADSRIAQSATAEPIVPNAAFRAGTLNYINSNPGCDDSSRLNTTPGCITTLPNTGPTSVASLDPAGIGFDEAELTYIDARYPYAPTAHGVLDPTEGDGVNTAGYYFNYPDPDDWITYVGRVDYNLTPTQRIFGRFTIDRRNTISSAPEFPSDPVTHPFIDRSYSYVISDVWDIGSNKVNQFYYGDTISKFEFPDTYNPTGADQYSISGLSGPYTAYDGQERRVPVPMVRDDFSWQHGTHSITMGGTFKFIKTNSNLITNFNYPDIGLYGAALGSGLDSSVRPSDINMGPYNVGINDYDNLFASALGVIGTISTNYTYNNKGVANPAGSGSPRAYRYYETEMYAGDTWKVNKKLTLTYGLHYQLYSVPYETHGDESVPVTSPANGINFNTFISDRIAQSDAGNTSNTGLPIYSYVLGGKANHGPNSYAPSYTDFAPRLAFAYTPFNAQKTVINGGVGIVYDRTVINSINFLQDQASYLFFNSTTNQFGSPASGPYSSVYESLANDTRAGTGLSYPSAMNPEPQAITTPYTPYVDSFGNPYGLAYGAYSFIISPNLKDPYSIALNFGVQRELPFNMILKVSYAGRLGRRLLADADANQVIDVPDYTGGSTQTMAEAFAGLTTQLRAGKDYTDVVAEPWFEDVIGPGGTSIVAYYAGQYAYRGDIADSLYELAYYSYYYGTGWLPTNIGIPSQFGTNAYLTNMGSSNYHGLLLTLDKNMSQGLRFEFNYTWSHSIDNTSVSANNNGLYSETSFICDVLHPRACRASSDFDVRQEITSNFTYDLPFGRGKMFAGDVSRWLDEAIGGWSFSGLPSYRTGLPVTVYSDAFLASFWNNDPAIFNGNKADLKTKVNVSDGTVWNFAGGSAGAAKALSDFSGPVGIQYGQRNLVRSAGAFFFDAGLQKKFPIYENRVNLIFRTDVFNLFNHPNFGPPGGLNAEGLAGLNIVTEASNFGQISATNQPPDSMSAGISSDYRVAQFSLRLEF